MHSRAWRLIADGSGAGSARRFLRIWAWYESFDLRIRPNAAIPGARWNVFRVTFVRHQGSMRVLSDGTEIRRGDRVCQLHISNQILVRIVGQGPWRAQSAMEDDLRALAASMRYGDFSEDVRAVFGVTVLARAGTRLGFTLYPCRRTLKAFLDRIYRQGLLALYCPQGARRLSIGRTASSWPDELWMSRGELMRRYACGR